MNTTDAYCFRPVIVSDLPLLAGWRAAEHVVEWWGAPEIEKETEKLADSRISMWIVEHNDRPFAFAQDYDVHGWDPHPFSYLPSGARGIDQYIGEADMLGKGHGTAFVRAHVQRLFAQGAPTVGTDPNPNNMRARRAYEKAGFILVAGPIITRWGEAVLMECRR